MREEKILVVEDEAIISLVIEETLHSLGYQNVDTAYNANEATKMLLLNAYDLVLMDIHLGGDTDGIDVISGVKEKKDVAVIYVTGNSDSKTLNKAKNTLPSGYITKPILERDLRIQVELVLHREKARKAEFREQEQLRNFQSGHCHGLTVTINLDGTITAITPHIYNITGQPTYHYLNKKISAVGLDPALSNLFADLLHKTKNSSLRRFEAVIDSPFIGPRQVVIETSASGFFSCQFVFSDVTNQGKEKKKQQK